MLLSKFKHTVDAKHRVFIPAKYREELGESFVISKSIRHPCLQIHSIADWDSYISPIMKMDRKDSENIVRMVLESAEQVSPDSQGRIVISNELVELTKNYSKVYFFEEGMLRGSISEHIVAKAKLSNYSINAIENTFVSAAEASKSRAKYSLDSKSMFNIIAGEN